MLLSDEEARDCDRAEQDAQPTDEEDIEGDMVVSLHVMKEKINCKIEGYWTGWRQEVLKLIDSGSTHCFINEKITRTLGCELECTTTMMIRVADGSKLNSKLICPKFSWEVQGHRFSHPVRLLKLGGYDLVLGCDWLSNYNPMELDFHQLKVTLSEAGKKLVLRALPNESNAKKEENTKVLELLQQYNDVFQEPRSLPPERSIKRCIDLLPKAIPKKQHPYRYAYGQKTEIERIVKEMLDSGIIKPSQSSFASTVLLLKKKDGGWRLCVDYMSLNKLIVKHNFRIPIIDESHGAKYFSKIDLRSREFVLVFFDDILVYSKDLGIHLMHLKKVMELLKKHQLYAKKSKCSFAQLKVEYLGHIISWEGVAIDPQKVECMLKWHVATTVKALTGFLRLTGYYRKFIKGYGIITKPLMSLLKKDAFEWNPQAEMALNQLKKVMTIAPVLAMPDLSQPFVVEIDACGRGIGAVLMQKSKLIAYLSKALATKNLGLST
ncbi:UNVERIFIED_CONTAM: Retrovirus-related Pol polyprotein from transposon [Sesamum angustifolium]|uniref:Retrovirus-related Pol polyprotein from transposon n=1 Tax=Sesamum angustifolium TaxID=2727405 RepID=A0AAW2IJI8_9LAMI